MNVEGNKCPYKNDDGSLNEEMLRSNLGIGSFEANQQVTYETTKGLYSGSVLEMLTSCPTVMTGWEKNWQKSGGEGIKNTIDALNMMGAELTIVFSEETLQFHDESVKKK